MMVDEKVAVSADSLYLDSFRLARKIFDSDYRPDVLVGLWRGGTPPAIAIHEALDYFGRKVEHRPLFTASYDGIDAQRDSVQVIGLDSIQVPGNRILVVDDVFDTGKTYQHVRALLLEQGAHEVRIATPYFKPERNKTELVPDYFIHETTEWLVFPHELTDLTPQEIRRLKGSEIADLLGL